MLEKEVKGKSTLVFVERSNKVIECYKLNYLSPEQVSSLRCHTVDFILVDDKTGCISWGRNLKVITKKGVRIKKVLDEFIMGVLNENDGYFDCFIPNPDWTDEDDDWYRYIPTEKSIRMAREIRDRILKHNDEILGIS